MASTDLTASTPTLCTGKAEIKTAIDLLSLTLVTDKLIILPISESNNQFLVFKVEREA